ncbi:MAG: hypothetical protein K2P76_12965 [Lachnospiraceae bacterium]|nr:hypothetical protein [Lachnospiraceae bacterium]MDE6981369.1 hypothetical protein [Lachnospiraceae bacterium]
MTLITRPRRFGKPLRQRFFSIEEKCYGVSLIAEGIEPDRIRKYSFALEGKTVLIGDSSLLTNSLPTAKI